MVVKVYCPETGASICPVQRALKVSAPMDGSGEPPPQSKFTLVVHPRDLGSGEVLVVVVGGVEAAPLLAAVLLEAVEIHLRLGVVERLRVQVEPRYVRLRHPGDAREVAADPQLAGVRDRHRPRPPAVVAEGLYLGKPVAIDAAVVGVQ